MKNQMSCQLFVFLNNEIINKTKKIYDSISVTVVWDTMARDVIFIKHLIVTFFPGPKFRDFQKIKEIKDL